MEKRVVITGLGAITPIGKNINETWESIENKKCGIDNITKSFAILQTLTLFIKDLTIFYVKKQKTCITLRKTIIE